MPANSIRRPLLPTTQGVTLVQSNVPILDDPWSLDYELSTLRELSALSVRPKAEAERHSRG